MAHFGKIYDVQSGTIDTALLEGGLIKKFELGKPPPLSSDRHSSVEYILQLSQACICGAESPASKRPSIATMACRCAQLRMVGSWQLVTPRPSAVSGRASQLKLISRA